MVYIATCCRLQVVLYLLNHTEFTGTITTDSFGCLPSPEKRVILDHKLILFAAYCHLCIFPILTALKMFPTCQTKTTAFKKLYKFCSSVTNTSAVITQMSLLKAHLQLTSTVSSPVEKRCRWFGVMAYMPNQNVHLSNTMAGAACNLSPSASCSK